MRISSGFSATPGRRLVSSRYERASLIVTSNKPFGRWGEVLGDEVVAAAMIDRLLHHPVAVFAPHPGLISGIAGSIGSVGDALDNALCESTIGLFKTEAINPAGPAWTDRRDVEWQVARWTHWYNTDRLHSSIGHLPPIEFEHHHRQARTQTPDREVA
jgi:hypothetical protein